MASVTTIDMMRMCCSPWFFLGETQSRPGSSLARGTARPALHCRGAGIWRRPNAELARQYRRLVGSCGRPATLEEKENS